MAAFCRFGSTVALKSFGSAAAWKPSPAVLNALQCRVISTSCVTSSQLVPSEDYWAKNKRLNRPTSPHLTIYKPQLTSMLSITHRGTGLLLSSLLSGFGIGMMLLPASYPYYIGLLSQAHYGAAVIFTVKFLMAFPFAFHTFNGIRHLTWDMGYGFTLRSLYKSGYGVLAVALVSSLALASY